MVNINYKAPWEAIEKWDNKIFVTSPDYLEFPGNTIITLELNIGLELPEGYSARIKTISNYDLILIPGEIEYEDVLEVKLFNPTPNTILISKEHLFLEIEFYRQSITFSSVYHSVLMPNVDTVTINPDQLESSIVRIPINQLQFKNLYIEGTDK